MVLVIPTQKLPPRVTGLPSGATHSGHSVGPASPHYRHSFRPLAAPPGTARGHRHTLGVDKGRGYPLLPSSPCCGISTTAVCPPPASPPVQLGP